MVADYAPHIPTVALLIVFGVAEYVKCSTMMARIGVTCFVLSFALSNAWTLMEYAAVPAWQVGLALILVMYGAVGKTWWPVALGGIALGLNQFDVLNRRPAELFAMIMIAASVYLVYRTVKFTDPVGKLVWVVLLVAEAWSAFEYAGCQFVSHFTVDSAYEGFTARYACGRAFGPVAPYIGPVLITLAMFTVGLRWNGRRAR